MKNIDIRQIMDYLRCPAYYEFRYIDGISLPRTAASFMGHCVRYGADYNYRQKLYSYRDMTSQELSDIVSDEFDHEADSVEWQSGEDKGQFKDWTLALLFIYLTSLAPQVQPLFLDSEYSIEFETLPGIPFTGSIKLVDEDLIIRDVKTSGRSPASDEVAKNLSLAANAMAYRKLTGRIEGGVALDCLVNTKQPKLVSVLATKTEEDIKRLRSIITQIVNAIKLGSFYPNPAHFFCSQKACGYWDACHARYRQTA